MKTWFKYSEHFEKYILLLMSGIGFFALLHLAYLTYAKDESMFQATILYFTITVWLAMAGMLIRKGMKMQISKDGLQMSQGEED
jgi:drug/metabolite transporter (DMT)-like permease